MKWIVGLGLGLQPVSSLNLEIKMKTNEKKKVYALLL
jgi:hypothetical protein